MSKTYYVYILASGLNGTLYIGMTGDLIKRVYQHKSKFVKGFAAEYDVTLLVYFEEHIDPICAIAREKQIKNWKREWKLNLIERDNPEWLDLYPEIIR